MSRHIIQANHPRFEIVVGYDRPLDELFGQVYDRGTRAPRLLQSLVATSREAGHSSWPLIRRLGTALEMLLERAVGSAEADSLSSGSQEQKTSLRYATS